MSHVIVYTLVPCDFFRGYATRRIKFHRVASAIDKIARVSYLARQRICNLLHWTIVQKIERLQLSATIAENITISYSRRQNYVSIV